MTRKPSTFNNFQLQISQMSNITSSQNPPDDQLKNSGTYIVILCLFMLLILIIISYLIRRYGCLNPATTATNDENGNQPRSLARGMDAQEIESLPSLRFSEIKTHFVKKTDHLHKECVVCLNEFKDQEILRILPDCLHVYHPHCIEVWLTKNATCPVCRAILDYREGSSVSLSKIVIEKFDMVDIDHAYEHNSGDLMVEIEGCSRLSCLEVNVGCTSARLRRSLSMSDLEVSKLNPYYNEIRGKCDCKANTP